MRLNFLCMQILLLMAFTQGKTVLASGFAYYKQVTGESDGHAKKNYDHIKELSNKFRFLDCPLELIERQWRGSESVIKGADFLQRFLRESTAQTSHYKPIFDECIKAIIFYRQMDRAGKIRARAIVGDEKEALYAQLASQSLSSEDQKLMTIIAENINQETLCQTQRVAFQAAYMLGASAGGFQMECVTPLGRRIKLKGPSMGIGIGVGASLSLPNIDSANPLSYGFALYLRPENKLWKVTNQSSSITPGVGVVIGQDMARRYRGYKNSSLYLYDVRPSVGWSIFNELTLNLLRKKDQSPLYIKLAQAQILDAMAHMQE